MLTTSGGKFGLGVMDSGSSSKNFSIVVSHMDSGAYSIHVDGLEKGTGTSSLAPAAFDKVGNDFAGQIAEIIAYDRGLSNGVRQKIEGYLAHKWGMESNLPSAHSYKVGKPAFGGNQVLTFQPLLVLVLAISFTSRLLQTAHLLVMSRFLEMVHRLSMVSTRCSLSPHLVLSQWSTLLLIPSD